MHVSLRGAHFKLIGIDTTLSEQDRKTVRKLGKLFDEMDANQDGYLNQYELEFQIQTMKDQQHDVRLKNFWRDVTKDGKHAEWRFINEQLRSEPGDTQFSFDARAKLQYNRFVRADKDKNEKLDYVEFSCFVEPKRCFLLMYPVILERIYVTRMKKTFSPNLGS
jgi:hypothetical protein